MSLEQDNLDSCSVLRHIFLSYFSIVMALSPLRNETHVFFMEMEYVHRLEITLGVRIASHTGVSKQDHKQMQ